MTFEEIKHDVIMSLTFSGALPSILPDAEIDRIIHNDAMPWFWENYDNSCIQEYIYIPSSAIQVEQATGYKYVQLPCNVQFVTWLYRTDNKSLFELGVSAPNLSVNMSYANSQSIMNSYLSTMGELGVYKVIIDSFADTMNQLSKDTLKYDFNHASKRLHILTSMGAYLYNEQLESVVAEVYSHIPAEDLYDLDHFRRYVRAKAGMQLGKLLKRYTYNNPGGVQINADAVYSDAEKELTDLMEEIKGKNPGSSWFYMVKR